MSQQSFCKQPVSVSDRQNRPGSNLAAFLRLRGFRTEFCCGTYWYEYRRKFFMALPYEFRFDPDRRELEQMLRETGAVGARFVCESLNGVPSGLYLCNPANFDVNTVQRRQRSKVRKGLDTFEMRPVQKRELLTQGIELNRETTGRQNRTDPEFCTPAGWERFVEAAYSAPGIHVMGAFEGDMLACYVLSCRDGSYQHLLYKHSRNDQLDRGCAWALDYTVLMDAKQDPMLEGVTNGFTLGIAPTEGLHQYKVRLGYQVQEHTMGIQLHPRLEPFLVNPLARGALSATGRWTRQASPFSAYVTVLQAANASRTTASRTAL